MKILFLDFDGVLNNTSMWGFAWNEDIDQADHLSTVLVSRLNLIVESTDCFIVISSAWRRDFSLNNLKHFLTKKGFKYSDKVIGVTPNIGFTDRGREINEWLTHNPTCESYAIVDDIIFDIDLLHHAQFIKTDSQFGLTEDNCNQLIKILNKRL